MADSGLIKAVTSDVKAIAIDGSERLLQVGDTVSLNETIITGNAGTVSIWLSDGTKLGLEENANTLLDESFFNQGLETIKDPVVSSAEDEVAAIQQALVDDQSFDPSKLEAPAAGGVPLVDDGDFVDGEGHNAVSVDYLNPAMTPESGFNTRGINNGDSLLLDLTSGELILEPPRLALEPVFINSLVPPSLINPGNGGSGSGSGDGGFEVSTPIPIENSIPIVQVTDHNGIEAGDNTVVEGSTTAVRGNFVLETSGGVASIEVAGVIISAADLDFLNSAGAGAGATTPSPISIHTDKGELSIVGYDEIAGVVDYSYLPASGAQDHSAGDESIVDQFEITVTDVNDVSSGSAFLDIVISDTVPVANDDTASLSSDQIWSSGNVVFNINNDGSDVLSVDVTKLTSVRFEGDEKKFINPEDVLDLPVSNDPDGKLEFITDNGILTMLQDGTYFYYNTDLTDGSSEDKFEYTLIDADGDVSTATLTIDQVIGGINTGADVDLI